jgi:hypothetical protein
MRYQYVVILKKTSERASDFLSLLLCLFSAISFFYAAVGSAKTNRAPAYTYFTGAAGIVLLAGLIFNLIAWRKGRQVRYRTFLIIAAVGWIGMTTTPWVGILFFIVAFLEYQTKRPLEIGFDRDRVVINTLVKQRFDWTAFNNIVLKDGLLTLDFKNNRLMQKEVADDGDDDDADEKEFNEYCRVRLAGADWVDLSA